MRIGIDPFGRRGDTHEIEELESAHQEAIQAAAEIEKALAEANPDTVGYRLVQGFTDGRRRALEELAEGLLRASLE